MNKYEVEVEVLYVYGIEAEDARKAQILAQMMLHERAPALECTIANIYVEKMKPQNTPTRDGPTAPVRSFPTTYEMKTTLLILLASAGLACAELSPEEFNTVRNRALTIGFYYSGTSQIDGMPFYTFCTQGYGGQVIFVPMTVTNLDEARAAMLASSATFLTAARRWKKPLDQLLHMTKTHLEDDADDMTTIAIPDGWEREPTCTE